MPSRPQLADLSSAPEVHIAGLLVQVRPGDTPRAARAIARLPGTEVHAVAAAGKLVVVCECGSADQTLALIERIRDLPGVLNVALVYQHAEGAAAMDEEISDETDPPRIH